MLTRLALLAIGAYQKWLSPYKGFSCAYRVMHGGPGCSGYARQVIQTKGPLSARPLLKERFAACKAAALAMSADRLDEDSPTPRKQRKKRTNRWCSPLELLYCAPAGCAGSAGASGGQESASTCDGIADSCNGDCLSGCAPGSCGDCAPGCCGG